MPSGTLRKSWCRVAAKWHKRGTCAARWRGVSLVDGFVLVVDMGDHIDGDTLALDEPVALRAISSRGWPALCLMDP